MKHIQNLELFEKLIKRKIRPISDFLFQKFFESPDYTYPKNTEQEHYDMVNGNFKNFEIQITFSRNNYGYFNKKDFLLFAEFIDYINNFSKNVQFKILGNVEIKMYFTSEEIQKIKELSEFKEWLEKADAENKKYLEERELKKVAKKYNI